MPYIVLNELGEMPLLTSTKQIRAEAERIIGEWSEDANPSKLWAFKELLSWKIPEYLKSTNARESQQRLQRKQEEEGYICSYGMHTQLYQLELVTSRVKEQKITFVGIVTHVKEYVSNLV